LEQPQPDVEMKPVLKRSAEQAGFEIPEEEELSSRLRAEREEHLSSVEQAHKPPFYE
jgi:hypothetical protein